MKTEVELSDGQSFAIGGLLDNSETETFQKIPFIGDVPILGKFFQSIQRTKTNTELIVIVTPEIVDPIPAGAPLPALKYPQKFLPPNSGIAMANPGGTEATPLAAPATMPVEQLIRKHETRAAVGRRQRHFRIGIRRGRVANGTILGRRGGRRAHLPRPNEDAGGDAAKRFHSWCIPRSRPARRRSVKEHLHITDSRQVIVTVKTLMKILNLTREAVLGDCVEVADRAATRNKGLLGRDGLGLRRRPMDRSLRGYPYHWYAIPDRPCVLDRKKRVKKVRSDVRPWRLSACLFAHSVLELASGTVHQDTDQSGR